MTIIKTLLVNRYLVDIIIENIDVESYVELLKGILPLVKNINVETFSGIQRLVKVSKEHGLTHFIDTSKYYITTEKVKDAKGKVKLQQKNLFEKNSGFMIYFKAKAMIKLFDYTQIDKNELLSVLVFFRLVSDKLDSVTDEMIENVFKDDVYNAKDLVKTDDLETTYVSNNPKVNKLYPLSLTKQLRIFLASQQNVSMEEGSLFRNKYGNLLRAIKIVFKTSKEDLDFIIYVPATEKGVYSIEYNKFIAKKSAESYMYNSTGTQMQGVIKLVLSSIVKMVKGYYINKDDKLVMRSLLQDAINSIFFGKRTFHYSKTEYDIAVSKGRPEGLNTYYQNKIEIEYKWNAFIMIASKTESLTDFEIDIEHRKFYFTEFVSSSGKGGDEILKNFGKRGYEQFRRLPLNNNWLLDFDPAYINNKGDFLIAWDGQRDSKGKKISLLDRLTPFAPYNLKSVRNAMSAFILGHAFELEGLAPDYKLTESVKSELQPPMYNEWFAFVDHVDSTGSSTNDGQRLINKNSRLAPYLYNQIKIAFPGSDKGISMFMDDDIYFLHNGQEIHVNAFSPINVASRRNFGVLLEGLYNGKKHLDGDNEQEFRDLYINPLKKGELLKPQELFIRRNGETKRLGKHFVGLMSTYFVKDPDSAYKFKEDEDEDDENIKINSNRLGTEFFKRNSLMGFKALEEYFLGTNEERREKQLEIESSNDVIKKYSKRGKIMKSVLQAEGLGFSSTVSANGRLAYNQARINLLESDLPSMLVTLKKINKDINIQAIKRAFYSGKEITIIDALQGRNPSMDDANQILVSVELVRANPLYTKYSFMEVNPLVWARQGGDFDGDQGSLIFLPKDIAIEANKYYGHHLRGIVSNGFEYKIMEMYDLKVTDILAIHTHVESLESFIKFISMVKSDDISAYTDLFTENGIIKHIDKKTTMTMMTSNLITTRISKQLIGVAKGITMKALEYIEEGLERFDITDQKLKDKLRTYADQMNLQLVQAVINIQKWNDNLKEVIATVLKVYRMSQLVGLTIESLFYPTLQTFSLIKTKAKDYGVFPEKILTTYEMSKVKDEFLFNYRDLISYAIRLNGLIITTHTQSGEIRRRLEHRPELAAFELGSKNPREVFAKMIEVINIDGTFYKEVLASVEKDMKDIDIDSMFFVI